MKNGKKLYPPKCSQTGLETGVNRMKNEGDNFFVVVSHAEQRKNVQAHDTTTLIWQTDFVVFLFWCFYAFLTSVLFVITR